MLPRIALPALCLLLASPSFCQRIEAISTDAEAVAFVNSRVGDKYNAVTLEAPRHQVENNVYMDHIRQFGPVVFEKADLDNNGHIDLLFNGYYRNRLTSFVILAFGNDSFRVRSLNIALREFYCMARVIMIDDRPCIRMLEVRSTCDSKERSFCPYDHIDTLVYAFNDLIERRVPAAYNIKKIKYCVFGGMDPIGFQLRITRDSIVLLSEPSMTVRIPVDNGGVFTAEIDTGTISSIFYLLNYMHFSELEKRYQVHRTDQLTGEVRVTFEDGSVKEVSDWGLAGTHGLSILHDLFFQLREKQHWKWIRPMEGSPIRFCQD